jgi:hypothetical protein
LSWGWFDQEAHVPSYFGPQYIEYAAPRYSERSSSYKDRFDQNRSRAQPKKKVLSNFTVWRMMAARIKV